MEQYTNPRIWGPHFWFILRCIVHNYPMSPTSADKQHMESFFYELQFALPCEKCKYTFKQHYNKFPINKYLTDRQKLIEWLDLIYEETNRSIANNRIKILDEFIDTGEMMPLKQIPKSEKDKVLEQHLNIAKKNVINNSTNGGLTTLPIFNNQTNNFLTSQTKTSFEPKKHVITTDIPIFDKQVNGKKNTEKKPVNTNQITNNQILNNQLANLKQKQIPIQIPMAKIDPNLQLMPTQAPILNTLSKQIPVPVPIPVVNPSQKTNVRQNIEPYPHLQTELPKPPITKHLSKTDKLTMQQQLFNPVNKNIDMNPHTDAKSKSKINVKPQMYKKEIKSTQQVTFKPNPNNKPIVPALPSNYNYNYTQVITNNKKLNLNDQIGNYKPKSITYSNLTVISKCKKCLQ